MARGLCLAREQTILGAYLATCDDAKTRTASCKNAQKRARSGSFTILGARVQLRMQSSMARGASLADAQTILKACIALGLAYVTHTAARKSAQKCARNRQFTMPHVLSALIQPYIWYSMARGLRFPRETTILGIYVVLMGGYHTHTASRRNAQKRARSG